MKFRLRHRIHIHIHIHIHIKVTPRKLAGMMLLRTTDPA